MTNVLKCHPNWEYRPAWSVFASREEFGGDGTLLSLSAAHGVRERIEGEGRAASEDTSGYRVVKPGDVVINRLVARDGAISVSEVSGIISPAYWVLKASEQADSRFLGYLLNSSPYLAEIGARSKFMPPAQFDLPWEQFRTLPIAYPDRWTQASIADFLDSETARIDALIDRKQRLISLCDARWRRHLLESVAPHLEGLPIPGGWKMGRLRNLVDRVVGGSWGVEPGEETFDLPCVRAADFDFRSLTATGGALRSYGFAEKSARLVSPGDLVLEKSGGGDESPVGRVVRWVGETDAVPTNFAARIRPTHDHDPLYVLFAFRAAYEAGLNWRSIKQTTGIQNLDSGAYLSEPWPAPPKNEQSSIAKHLQAELDTTLQLVVSVTRQIELLREHRQALITAAVTGQIEIPGVAA